MQSYSEWATEKGRLLGPVMECLSQGHINTMPCSRTELRVDNLAVVNLHYYPLSCTAASRDIDVNCVFQEHNSALCPAWVSYQQPYNYYSALEQTVLCRRLWKNT